MILSLLLTLFGLVAAAVLLLTVIIELNDMPRMGQGKGWREHVRHHARAIGLVLMGASAGMQGLQLLAGLPANAMGVMLLVGVTLVYLSRSPGWIRYLLFGDRRQVAQPTDRDRRLT